MSCAFAENQSTPGVGDWEEGCTQMFSRVAVEAAEPPPTPLRTNSPKADKKNIGSGQGKKLFEKVRAPSGHPHLILAKHFPVFF